MRQRQRDFCQPLNLIALFAAIAPLIFLANFIGYVAKATVYLGHLPSYNNPDPKRLGWWLQHDTIALGFYFWPALLGAGVFVAIIGRAIAKDFPIGKMLFVSCFSVAIFFLYLKIDPGDFLSWYWD